MSHSYLNLDTKIVTDASDAAITALYDSGYYFGRIGKGVVTKTRLVRIDLAQFELSSENRRILRKTEELDMMVTPLPLASYHWSLGKMMKDFYDKKFGKKTFSANKAKEILTGSESNFTLLLNYFIDESTYEKEFCGCAIVRFDEQEHEHTKEERRLSLGYAICYENNTILHYAYPFYNLAYPNKDIGMGMMLRAILYAKEQHKTHIYLGSAQRPADSYKLQFKGVEWFDENHWNNNPEELKTLITQA